MCPHIAPHIVITPAEETWEDESIPWQNSVDPQWPFYLCVPPLDYSNGRMLVIEPHPLSETQTDPILFNTTQSPSLAFGLLRPVFRPSIFEHSANESSQNENQSSYFQWSSTLPHVHDLSDEMMNFQKAACKATFFSASDIARALRKRYDFQPNVLSDVEPGFTWTDPAEPLLIANRRMLGATILDSICPFLTPHIIINSPPPQPYHLTENNTTPYTQDAAFGDRLVVEASYTSIINETGYSPASSTSIVDNWKDQSFYCSSLVDLDESTIDSRPGSPLPETPDDHDDDHYFHFAQFDDGVLNENGLAIHHEYQSIYRVDSPVQVDLYAQKFQATSRSIFYIEEDDDELPSLDDW
ncbi:hypothetical protein C0992_004602 [Termitomyces sp. T32_za158]|nr:hypothetical protein C0992_004602 [Termitomyces sp. T32_za158]